MEIENQLQYAEINRKTTTAYRLYSQYYAVISLLAYWIVWRGKIFRHIAFFRQLKNQGTEILDIATGDGSLTKAALFAKKPWPAKVTCIDISPEMLKQAEKKFPAQNVKLMIGDVMSLPYGNHSMKTISCFGGFNSFPSGDKAMAELSRVLAKDGVLRGSLLLMPKETWRQNLVLKWIREGYQTEVITESTFQKWMSGANLSMTMSERNGDVLLFELRHA